jgi:hypothetical protein
VERASLTEGDHSLCDASQFLCLGIGRANLFVFEQRRHHIAKKRLSV